MRTRHALAALLLAWASMAFARQPQPTLPDPALTPGDAFDVSPSDLCTPGYSKKVRNVPQSLKEAVYREYGITKRHRGGYECDHRAT